MPNEQKMYSGKEKLNSLFDNAHADALTTIKLAEHKQLLIAQRGKERKGCIGGIDRKLESKERRAEKRRLIEHERKVRYEERISQSF